MSKVGFIGVGTMGCPMASNIISKGNDLKFYDPYVHDENKSKLINLGAEYCTSITDLLDDRDFTITMLPNGNNVKDVCLGEHGLLKQEKKDEFGNNIAEDGGKVAFFSLEMSSEQLATRVLAQESKISGDKMRKAELNKEDFKKIAKVSSSLEHLNLIIVL